MRFFSTPLAAPPVPAVLVPLCAGAVVVLCGIMGFVASSPLATGFLSGAAGATAWPGVTAIACPGVKSAAGGVMPGEYRSA